MVNHWAWANILVPSTTRCNAEICSRPKGHGWSVHTGSVPIKPKNWGFGGKWSLSKKCHNSVPKELAMTSSHVLCSNFTEIGCREGMTRCFAMVTKKFTKCVFLLPFCARSAQGAKSLQRSMPTETTSSCKISSQSVPVCRSYFWKSDFVWLQYMPSAYNQP